MNNILAIMRRDLGAYFTSPIGYIFMMVFVTISVGLYITSFFMFPVADMRPYFDNLPLLLCVFVPAVTMRVWAEERKENTWEMLLTFPMQARELVLGKFLASVVFFAVTVFSTVTIPVMLYKLGNPDTGAILSGYLGTLLLGAFFLSMGILFSGFFKDQIVAFAVTLLACFAFFLLGTDFIAAYIDDRIHGLGSTLSYLLGFFSHYQAFTKGVIEVADVVYFVAWTAICLVLNVLYIDGRNRPGAKMIFLGAAGLSIVIGLLFNYLMVGETLLRFDMTQDKVYTVSKASKSILSAIDTPVQVKYYVSPRDEMPAGMTKLEQDVTDKLEELKLSSGGKLQYTAVHLQAANVLAKPEDLKKDGDKEKDKDEGKKVEERMLDKGVEPFAVRVMEQGSTTSKLVYSSIGIAYKDRKEEIIPQIVPQSLEELEYRLVSTCYKLTREKKPVVALVAPKEAVNIDPQMRQLMMQMGQQPPESDDPYEFVQQVLESEKYEVKRVELTKESPLPDEYDTLMVVNPRNLNDRQRWEINRALLAGKAVVIAVQNYQWDYRPSRNGMTIARRDEKPEINQLLESYGLKVNDAVLMDKNTVPLNMQSGNDLRSMLGGGMTVNLPMQIMVTNKSMAQDTAVTNRLSNVFYLWGTALDIDKGKLDGLKLTEKTVMSTADTAWERTITGTQLTNEDIAEAPAASRKAYPLMAMVEGQFPDAFAGKPRPTWPKANPQERPGQPPQPEDNTPEAPAKDVTAKPGKLVLLGCSQMFRKEFIRSAPQHLDLLLNSVDAITLDDNIVNVRGQKPIDRTIEKPDDGVQTMWRAINYGLANLVIAGFGITYFWLRRQSRNAYTLSMMRS